MDFYNSAFKFLSLSHTNFYIYVFEALAYFSLYFFPSFLNVQYHDSLSLRHWLQQSDWLPTLEATLALDEESVRRVGDATVGGPAVSRQLRLIRALMRDLLIGVGDLISIHKPFSFSRNY